MNQKHGGLEGRGDVWGLRNKEDEKKMRGWELKGEAGVFAKESWCAVWSFS
jgi:hypothetical protein